MWKTAGKGGAAPGGRPQKPKCRFFMQVAGLDGDGGGLAAAMLPQALAAEPDSPRVEPRGIRKPFLRVGWPLRVLRRKYVFAGWLERGCRDKTRFADED